MQWKRNTGIIRKAIVAVHLIVHIWPTAQSYLSVQLNLIILELEHADDARSTVQYRGLCKVAAGSVMVTWRADLVYNDAQPDLRLRHHSRILEVEHAVVYNDAHPECAVCQAQRNLDRNGALQLYVRNTTHTHKIRNINLDIKIYHHKQFKPNYIGTVKSMRYKALKVLP